MSAPLTEWHEDHVKFTQLLDLLEEQVAAFHRGEHPNYDLMSDIVFYLRSFGDCVHHPREDAAFERLLARKPELGLVINRLLQEHRVIATAGEDLADRLNQATGDVMAPREGLEAAAATYLVYYRNHLDTEERDIMPPASEVLTPEDWARVMATVPHVSDPLFGKDVEARFGELRKQIAREQSLTFQG